MEKALLKTDFHFEGQKSLYKGKVRDVYDIDDKYLVMVATDRISIYVPTGKSLHPTLWLP